MSNIDFSGIQFNAKNLDLKKIQDRLLHIGLEVKNIFEKNDIRYMIAFGTLLGAVRHKDMVPWDDDFDMFLFEEDYERASVLLRGNLPEDLFLEDAVSEPNYFHAWSHVKDLKSDCSNSLYPADDVYVHKGLHVDLYRFKKIRRGDLPDYLRDENIAYINRRKNRGLIDSADYERRSKIDFSEYAALPEEKGEEVYVFDGPYKQKTMKPEDVFPLSRYEIRGNLFYGPYNADHVLKSIYGDYMTPPPLDKRSPKLDKVFFA